MIDSMKKMAILLSERNSNYDPPTRKMNPQTFTIMRRLI